MTGIDIHLCEYGKWMEKMVSDEGREVFDRFTLQ